MKKVLTISIAAYNVEKYLDKALKSLIIKNMNLLEVLIVNDGSKDKTLDIANIYTKKYPNTFKIIDKENGGYGSTINAGVKNATGKYFKQLDGDDWYDTENLNKLCMDLKSADEDIIYTPYIMHRITDNNEKLISNNIVNSRSKLLDASIKLSNGTIYMHNLAFKTSILKENKIRIDENCFYTDTEYIIFPMIHCKTIKSFNYPIYIYRYGDENQSVGRIGRLKHYRDHLKMSKSILSKYNDIEVLSSNVKNYLDNYLASIFSSGISNYLMILPPSKTNYLQIKNYDDDIKRVSISVYNKMSDYSRTVRIIRKGGFLSYYIINIIKKVKGK